MCECKKCGVELDKTMNFCPLCGEQSDNKMPENDVTYRAQPIKESKRQAYNLMGLTNPQKQKLFWELSGIILLTGMTVTFIIDLLTTHAISWSKYTLTIGIYLFLNISFISFLKNKIAIMAILSFISTSLLLVIIDVFNNNLGWGLKLGIPLIFFIYLAILVFLLAVKKTSQKGINLIAFFLLLVGILCMAIETLITLHLGNFQMVWSPILLVSVFSIAIILLFIHYRLKKVTDLKRFFHI